MNQQRPEPPPPRQNKHQRLPNQNSRNQITNMAKKTKETEVATEPEEAPAYISPPEEQVKLDWPTSTEERMLECTMNREEMHAKTLEAHETNQKIDEALVKAARAADAAKYYKAQAVSLGAERDKLIADSSTGLEIRLVPCRWEFECDGRNEDGTFKYDPAKKTLFRLEKAIADEEPQLSTEPVCIEDITDADRERSLPFEEQEVLN